MAIKSKSKQCIIISILLLNISDLLIASSRKILDLVQNTDTTIVAPNNIFLPRLLLKMRPESNIMIESRSKIEINPHSNEDDGLSLKTVICPSHGCHVDSSMKVEYHIPKISELGKLMKYCIIPDEGAVYYRFRFNLGANYDGKIEEGILVKFVKIYLSKIKKKLKNLSTQEKDFLDTDPFSIQTAGVLKRVNLMRCFSSPIAVKSAFKRD